MGVAKIRNIRLRKRIIQILKSYDGDELPSASALLELVLQSGMSQRMVGSTARIAQICRTTKGIGSFTGKVCDGKGEFYTAELYYLDSEEDFNDWVASKMG
mgnify:CR=1 FL=1